ncbi:MAG: glycosyltransferase family 4 protein [Microthrixaceae bacterium]
MLVITNDLPPRVGGIQYYVDQLCRGLVDAGDEVVLLGSNSPGSAAHDAHAPYEVVRERTAVLLPTPLVTRHAVRLVRRIDADVVVFGATFPLAAMAGHIRRVTGVRSVGFTHGLEVTAARTPGGSVPLRLIGRNLAAITYVSGWCRAILEPAFGPSPQHRMLPPAVDPEEFHPGVDAMAVRARWGIGDDPLVVCVSRLVERKGQDTLIDCLAQWRSDVPGTRLMIVGDGPHRATLEAQADGRGVTDAVTFTGEVPEAELPEHFATGDVFAMPCRERMGGREVEAFGIVFTQAQAVGVPVVAGNIGGVPDAVRDGATGLLVDGTDTAAVGKAVGDLLGDPVRRRSMGSAGARWCAESFGWPQRTAELRGILAQVVG